MPITVVTPARLIAKPAPGTIRRKVWESLDYEVGFTSGDLVTDLRISTKQVYRALHDLRELGLVERQRRNAGSVLWFRVGATADNDPTTRLPSDP